MGRHKDEKVPAEYQEAMTSKRKELDTLSACMRDFSRRSSPRYLVVMILAALIVRVAVGEWGKGDLITPFVVLLLVQPFLEWVVHVVVLHMKPFTFAGRQYDLYSARWHRVHHHDPSNLDQVLIKLPQTIAILVGFPIAAPLVVWGVTTIFGGQILPISVTAVLFCYVGALRYEWAHYLVHCPYIPKSRYFRKIWRHHRLHHYKHEEYWMGVSSTFSDRVLGTAPDQATIKKSPTARTLGVDTDKYPTGAGAKS